MQDVPIELGIEGKMKLGLERTKEKIGNSREKYKGEKCRYKSEILIFYCIFCRN